MRPLSWEDEASLAALYADPAVSTYLPPMRPNGVREMIKDSLAQWELRGFGPSAVFNLSGEEFLGKSGLNYVAEYHEIEVKWLLRPEYWGQGFATEAGEAWINWCLHNTSAPHVIARIHPDNKRSIDVAERLNMRFVREIEDKVTDRLVIFSTQQAGQRRDQEGAEAD